MTEIVPAGQRVLPIMGVLLAVETVLVFAAGTQLCVLSAHTKRYFAWTITTPTIGAFYYAAVAVAGVSAWQRRWHMARVGVPGILVFLWLTIGASLAHLAVFHLHAQGAVPRASAIGWLVIYSADPPLLLLAYVLQILGSGADPPGRRSRPGPAGPARHWLVHRDPRRDERFPCSRHHPLGGLQPTPARQPHASKRTREGNWGTTLTPARPTRRIGHSLARHHHATRHPATHAIADEEDPQKPSTAKARYGGACGWRPLAAGPYRLIAMSPS